MARFADDAYAWTTEVKPETSNAEIQTYLRKNLKADEIIVAWSEARGELLVSFMWEKQTYRMLYKPLEVKPTDRWGYKKTITARQLEQAHRQMYRRALAHLKLIVDMAQDGYDEILLPYTPMLGGPTLQKLGVLGMEEMVRNAAFAALPAPAKTEFREVEEDTDVN